MPRAPLALLPVLGLLTLTSPARADLADDAARLAASWTARGAAVERLDPVFLERGRARVIDLDRPGKPSKVEGSGCVTVAVLAVRTTELFVDEGDAGAGRKVPDPAVLPLLPLLRRPEEDRRTRSAGGGAVVSRCGASSFELKRITVEVTSPRFESIGIQGVTQVPIPVDNHGHIVGGRRVDIASFGVSRGQVVSVRVEFYSQML